MACYRCICPACGRHSIVFHISQSGDRYRVCERVQDCGFEELLTEGERVGYHGQP